MSSSQADQKDRFIWATRGRTWGFRFLRSGGYKDPLNEYERAFSEIGDQPEGWCRVADDVVALRFLDPQERQDAAGRVIPHEFVLLGPWAGPIGSLDEGRQLIWPKVADEFEGVWDEPDPPSEAG